MVRVNWSVYNFFIVNVFHHTSWKTSRWDVEAPETLESLGSFNVSASVSEAATSRLRLISDKILNVSVSSQFRRHGSWVLSWLRRSRAHPWYTVQSLGFCDRCLSIRCTRLPKPVDTMRFKLCNMLICTTQLLSTKQDTIYRCIQQCCIQRYHYHVHWSKA